MTGNEEHKHSYSAGDIRRYAEGKMSPEEMHAIEKAALDDPFLADAMEGFDASLKTHGASKLDASSQNLAVAFHKRLRKESKNRGVVPLKSWQAAVAAAILITAGILGYLVYEDKAANTVLSDNHNTSSPAQEKSDDRGRSFADTPKPAVAGALREINNTPATVKNEDNRTPAAKIKGQDQTLIKSDETASQQDVFAKPDAFTRTKGAKAMATRESGRQPAQNEGLDTSALQITGAAGSMTTADMPPLPIAAPRRSDSVPVTERLPAALQGKVAGISTQNRTSDLRRAPNIFRGQVITEDERPLSNAVLKLPDDKSYTTDNNGNFVIVSEDTVINVEVTMIGAGSQHFTLRQNPVLNKLILPDSKGELADVVVAGYGTRKRKDTSPQNSVLMNAAPIGGWPAFRQYLAENLNPRLKQNPPDSTQVSFRLSDKNKLSGFKITRSVSPEHDQEAIRLIKEGPAWQVLKGKKATVTVTIVF